MNINIKTIPHKEQRYETVGDWWFDKKGNLEIRVSNLGDWKKEYLVASHEMREALLCKAHGITQKQCDDFDMKYEKDRIRGKYTSDQEPGDDPDAPYRFEHFYATTIERMDALAFGVDWSIYEGAIANLSQS